MRRNWLEWVILVVSVAAIVGLAGYLAIRTLAGEGAPPSIVAEVDPAMGADGPTGWTVPVVIRNDGDGAVRALTIEARAEVAGSSETSALGIDLLGPHSETEGAIGFTARPDGPIEIRVVSFEVP